jgi:hypothetical protein
MGEWMFDDLHTAGCEWSASRPSHFTPWERAPSTHWIGGLVEPTAGLDDIEKRKLFTLPGLELRHLGRPARSPSLYRLRYVDFKPLVILITPDSAIMHQIISCSLCFGIAWSDCRVGKQYASEQWILAKPWFSCVENLVEINIENLCKFINVINGWYHFSFLGWSRFRNKRRTKKGNSSTHQIHYRNPSNRFSDRKFLLLNLHELI